MNSKTAIKNIVDVPNKFDKQGSSLSGNSINGDVKVVASESKDYRIGFSKSFNRGMWVPFEAEDALCLEVGSASIAFINRNGVKEFSPNLVGGYHLGSNTSRWDTVKVKDLDASQYLRINAYSGYGSGGTSIWYDNTEGKKALALGGVAELSLEKAGYSSMIKFAAQSNDPGFIEHYENDNVSRMRFSVSDDAAANQDYFEWGTTEGGNWSQAAKLNANGAMSIKNMLYVNGDKGVWHSGNFDPNTKANSSHGHDYIGPAGFWSTNGGQDLMARGKRALVAMENGELHLGYGNDFPHIRCCNNNIVLHTGNHSHGNLNKNIFVQQDHPSPQSVGDVWISW